MPRFSSHALGLVIISIGLLALGRRGVFERDRIAIARTKLWCSRVGSWMASIAGWRLRRQTAVRDALLLIPERAEARTSSTAQRPTQLQS